MCENLYDGVSQKICKCAWCGKIFEGNGSFCSEKCRLDDMDEEEYRRRMDDYWD